MNLYLDIETIPTQKPRLRELAEQRALKKWEKGRREHPFSEEEAFLSTSLDAAFGEIVVIGVATADRKPKTYARDLHESEGDMLRAFRDDLHTLHSKTKEGVRLIGLNVLAFDRPFVRQRGIVNGIGMPPIITAEVKPWEREKVCDLMALWTDDKWGRVSLDVLCAALDLPGKSNAFNGSDVWSAMQLGLVDEVAAYCGDDVTKTRACFLRMTDLDFGTAS